MLIRPTSSWMPFFSTSVRIRDSVNFSVTARSAGGAPIVGRNPSAGRNAHGALSGSTPAPKPRGAETDVPAAVPEPGSASQTVSPYTAWPLASISPEWVNRDTKVLYCTLETYEVQTRFTISAPLFLHQARTAASVERRRLHRDRAARQVV